MQVEAMLVLLSMEIMSLQRSSGAFVEGDIYVDGDDDSDTSAYGRSQTTTDVFLTTETWYGGIVPVYIDNNILSQGSVYQNVKSALQTVSIRTDSCVTFPEKTSSHTDYVNITRIGDGCYSALGRRGGQQIINIGATCDSVGIIMHEILHALGLWHEQSRTDRDKYVTILEDNIIPGKEDNFNTHDGREAMERATQYDLESIMHYKYNQFSLYGSPTILPKDSSFPKEKMGQRERLTDKDVDKIAWLYKCRCTPPASTDMVIKPTGRAYKDGSTVTFKCIDPGTHQIVGAESSVCTLKDGSRAWAGAVPICVDKNLVNKRYLNKLVYDSFEESVPAYRSSNGQLLTSLESRQRSASQSNTDHTYERKDQGSFFIFNSNAYNRKSWLYTPSLTRNTGESISLVFFYSMYSCSDDTTLNVTISWLSVSAGMWRFRNHVVWSRHGPTQDPTWYCKHIHDITTIVNDQNIGWYWVKFEVLGPGDSNAFIAVDDILVGPSDDVTRFVDLQHCGTYKDNEEDTNRLGGSGIKNP